MGTIDLKPNTWIAKEEQATKVRPRAAEAAPPPANPVPAPRAPSPARGLRKSPSVGAGVGSQTPSSARGPSPMARNSPRGNYGQRAASPMIRRSPSVGSNDGNAPSRAGASPMQNRSPSVNRGRPNSARGRSPSVGAKPTWGAYKVGDPVEYHSSSHKDWLPASIIKVDANGRIIIDLKPNTWITKEEQVGKIRP